LPPTMASAAVNTVGEVGVVFSSARADAVSAVCSAGRSWAASSPVADAGNKEGTIVGTVTSDPGSSTTRGRNKDKGNEVRR
jgi:hypothetical protein